MIRRAGKPAWYKNQTWRALCWGTRGHYIYKNKKSQTQEFQEDLKQLQAKKTYNIVQRRLLKWRGSSEFGSIATVFSYCMFLKNICHTVIRTFQCLVIQRVKSVMNTVTDKKCHPLLSHRNGCEVVSG